MSLVLFDKLLNKERQHVFTLHVRTVLGIAVSQEWQTFLLSSFWFCIFLIIFLQSNTKCISVESLSVYFEHTAESVKKKKKKHYADEDHPQHICWSCLLNKMLNRCALHLWCTQRCRFTLQTHQGWFLSMQIILPFVVTASWVTGQSK